MESFRTLIGHGKNLTGTNGARSLGETMRVPTVTRNGRFSRGETSTATRLAGPSNHILSRLDPTVHKRLFRSLRPVDLKKDQFIFQQGQKHEFVYFPESAVISKFHILEDGRTIEVEVTGNEGAVGVTSLFNSPTAINCAQVCIPGTAYRVESDIVLSEARNSSALNELVCQQICRQLTNLSQKVICNTFHHVEQRLSTWLLMLDEKCDGDYLTMTQEHIARVLGVHRPSVTYIAQEMRSKKLIDYVRGRIYIRDRKGLEKIACVCYSEMHSEM